MTAPDAYLDWDAAYVLGALTSAERHDYERHLVDCAECARRVAELAALPGLLGTVPIAAALELDRQDESPPDELRRESDRETVPRLSEQSLPRLMERMRRRRRRLRVLAVGVLVAVAGASAAVALVLPAALRGGDAAGGPGAQPVAVPTTPPTATKPAGARTVMQQVVPSPLSASFVLTGRPWGTRIDSSCSYAQTGSGSGPRAYSMYVTDTSGAVTLAATWLAGPGTTIEAVGTTSVAEGDIAAVDIRLEPDGVVLLSARPET